MINAKELRIGNWVYYRNSFGTDVRVKMDVFFFCYMVEAPEPFNRHGYGNKYEQESIHAIPLSPEILEDCGFENNKLEINFYCDIVFIENCCRLSFEYTYVGEPIKYLHQLQNLYFALTGSELVIDHQKLQRSVPATAK